MIHNLFVLLLLQLLPPWRATAQGLPPQAPVFDPAPPAAVVQGAVVAVAVPDAEWVCYYVRVAAAAGFTPKCGIAQHRCRVGQENRTSPSTAGSATGNAANATGNAANATDASGAEVGTSPRVQLGSSLSVGPIKGATNISAVGCRMSLPVISGNASENTSTTSTHVLEGPLGTARYTLSATDAGVPFATPPSGSLVALHAEIRIHALLAEFLCVTSATDAGSGWPSEPQCPDGSGNACPVGRYTSGDNVTVRVAHATSPQWKAVGCRHGVGGDSPSVALVEYKVGPVAGVVTLNVGQDGASNDMRDKLRLNGPRRIPWTGNNAGGRRRLNATASASPSSNSSENITDAPSPSSEVAGASPAPSSAAFLAPSSSSPTAPAPAPAPALPDLKIPSYLVRFGASIYATAPNASAVCVSATVFPPGDPPPSDDVPCAACADPSCLADGTCAAPATTAPIIIDTPGATTIVRATACQDTRPAISGTSSTNITEARFTPSVEAGEVKFAPISTGVVQENTVITMSAANALLICWTDDVSIDPLTFPYCDASAATCIAPAKSAKDTNISITSDLSPYSVTAKGCTDTRNVCDAQPQDGNLGCNPLGTNSPRFTAASFRVGVKADAPQYAPEGGDDTPDKPATPVTAIETVRMSSLGARSICWTARKKTKDGNTVHRWDADAAAWTESSAETDPTGWPLPECNNAGTLCLQGSAFGEATPANIFSGIGTLSDTDFVSVEIRSIGCVDTTPGTGGGTNSPVTIGYFRIVPRIFAPTFHSKPTEGKTTFQGTSGKIELREPLSQADFFCYTASAYDRIAKQVVGGLAAAPQCSADGSACAAGLKMEVATELPILSDTLVQAQACASSAPLVTDSNRNSDVSSQVYLVVSGDGAVLTALEELRSAASTNTVWNVGWDLENIFYCNAYGVTCGVCPAADPNCDAKEQVSGLSLSYNGLGGDFSKFGLAAFSNTLVELTLAGNALSGGFPSSLWSLKKLTSLSLFYNSVSGDLPDKLGDLTNLVELDLDHNELTGPIPDTLSKLTKLSKLDLGNNQLSGEIPKSLAALTNLDKLDLSNNQLEGSIPAELDELTKLKALNVAGNPNLDTTLSDVLCVRTRTCMATFDENGAGRLAPAGSVTLLGVVGVGVFSYFYNIAVL